MKKATLAMCVLLASLAAGAAQATCIYPREPDNIPDGATASYDEMVAAQQAVKQFDADITAYNACLELELQSLLANPEIDEGRKQELRVMQTKKNNAAVDDVQAVVDRFNEQLRVFRERNKKE
jgi:ABC-type branched-subunit amino acid transport system substrate-binding protein